MEVAGKPPDEWKGAYGSKNVTVGPGEYPDPAHLSYSTERGPVLETDPQVIYPDSAGIKQLLERGALRQGSVADVIEWRKGYTKFYGQPPGRDEQTAFRDIYLVVKDTALPSGLAGGNSVTFIVAKDITPPEEAPGHSGVC